MKVSVWQGKDVEMVSIMGAKKDFPDGGHKYFVSKDIWEAALEGDGFSDLPWVDGKEALIKMALKYYTAELIEAINAPVGWES